MFSVVSKIFSIASAVAVTIAVFAVASNKAHSADFFIVPKYCNSIERTFELIETEAVTDVYKLQFIINNNQGCTDFDQLNKAGRPAVEVGVTYVEIYGYLYEITIIQFLDDRTQYFYTHAPLDYTSLDNLQRLIVDSEVKINARKRTNDKTESFFGFRHGELFAE